MRSPWPTGAALWRESAADVVRAGRSPSSSGCCGRGCPSGGVGRLDGVGSRPAQVAGILGSLRAARAEVGTGDRQRRREPAGGARSCQRRLPGHGRTRVCGFSGRRRQRPRRRRGPAGLCARHRPRRPTRPWPGHTPLPRRCGAALWIRQLRPTLWL